MHHVNDPTEVREIGSARRCPGRWWAWYSPGHPRLARDLPPQPSSATTGKKAISPRAHHPSQAPLFDKPTSLAVSGGMVSVSPFQIILPARVGLKTDRTL